MKRRILSGLALVVSLTSLVILLFTFSVAAEETQTIVTVCPSPGTGCDFTSIQEAIDSAERRSTIRVARGVYVENLTIAKRLTLEGGYRSSDWERNITKYETIIDGSNSRTVVGDWDGAGVGYPMVINDGGTYEMWYVGYNLYGVGRIGYATSPDGLNWTKHGANPVLDLGAEDDWDEAGVEAPFVIKESATLYKMWYSGRDDGGTWRVGYATSPDGDTWTKYAGNPIVDLGGELWNNRQTHGPSVLYEGGIYKMWLHTAGADGGDWTPYMAYASSPDGITWTWHANNPLFSIDPTHSWERYWIWRPSVLHESSDYQMWYSASGSDGGSIGYATAPNKTAWTKYNGGAAPVLTGTPGEWDEGDAYNPFVLYASGTYTMYYDSDTAIGVATSGNGIAWTKETSNPVLEPGSPGQWGKPVLKFKGNANGSILDGFIVRKGEAEDGAGIYIQGVRATIQDCTVRNNSAYRTGGGISVTGADADVTLVGNLVKANTALEGGGGISIDQGAKATINSNRILSNITDDDLGSGLRIDTAEVTVDGNTIANNVCDSYVYGDGALGVDMDGPSVPVTITNNLIVDNVDKGIMVHEGVSDLRIVNNTIASNRNEGVLAWGTIIVPLLRNNIIVSNGSCGVAAAQGAEMQTIDYNDVWDNGGGGGNYCDYGGAVVPPAPGPGSISADPQFVDAAGGDYRLAASSPALDTGTSAGAPDHDKDDKRRPLGRGVDMGAYEMASTRSYLPLAVRSYPPQSPTYSWIGEVANTFPNCGITRVLGLTLDRVGGVTGDIIVHVWTDGWDGVWHRSSWILDEGYPGLADESNWDVVLSNKPMQRTWYVCVVPDEGSWDCTSNKLDVKTVAEPCGPTSDGVQVVHIIFQQN